MGNKNTRDDRSLQGRKRHLWSHVGDEVIRESARCVNDKIRTTDILSRYDGDEFVAILPNTTMKGGTVRWPYP